MLRVGENLNVMVKKIGTAMKDRDPKPIQELAISEAKAGVDFIDINLGPARKGGGELMERLASFPRGGRRKKTRWCVFIMNDRDGHTRPVTTATPDDRNTR